MAKEKKKTDNKAFPSVLSFEKKMVFSDGVLAGTKWAERHKNAEPLHLIEKSVRGTISNRLKDAIKNDPAKLNAEVEKANPHLVDACALRQDQDTLKLSFNVKVLSGIEKPSACNKPKFAKDYGEAAGKYIAAYGFRELARRYAMNLANGRYLWRNRVGVEKLEVVIAAGDNKWTIGDALQLKLRGFKECDEYKTQIDEIAARIADALCGRREYLLLEVTAYALVGRAQEVYPSEELVPNKEQNNRNKDKDTKKDKILYQVDGVAAMHSQKIGNAVRTIDDWYPDDEEYPENPARKAPIAAEPYGAVTTQGRAYRHPNTGKDFYTLFDKWAWDGAKDETISETELHYVMAVLVRGGVFGKKEDKKADKKADKQAVVPGDVVDEKG